MYKNQIKFFLSCSLLSLSLGQVDYNSQIQPIFNSSCTNCHSGSDAEKNLSLTSYNNVMNGGDSGDVVIPYEHANSLLWQMVNSGAMPENNPNLTIDEIDLIAQWINEGALAQPGPSEGCTDPEAYNCADDVLTDENPNYIFDIGGTMYDNSCNWDWNLSDSTAYHVGGCDYNPDNLPEDFDRPNDCQGYYNDTTDGCRYYQAPHGDEVVFTIEEDGISVSWDAFTTPTNAILESYHVQRCLGESCTWMIGFAIQDINTSMSLFDEFDWEACVQIKYAIAVTYSNNPYWGWAIGASYITPPSLGDLNGDGGWNVLDIVTLANCVLAGDCAELPNGCAGDLNGDGGWNVLDIVILANCVLGQCCEDMECDGGRIDDASEAALIKKDNIVSIEANGFIGGVQMTLTHGSDFTIEITDRALFADYLTAGNETRLLVITPETEELFSFTGEFEITEVIVANSQDEVAVDMPIATSFTLSDAYPNPFNPVTTMTLTMPIAGEIKVEVYNLLGQVVANLASGFMEASTYTLTWDASNASSGVYFVQADAEGFTKTQKLMLVK